MTTAARAMYSERVRTELANGQSDDKWQIPVHTVANFSASGLPHLKLNEKQFFYEPVLICNGSY